MTFQGTLGTDKAHKVFQQKLPRPRGGGNGRVGVHKGEAFSLTVGAFLLTVRLLYLQSVKALIRRTFPL